LAAYLKATATAKVSSMNIVIVGAGNVGRALATGWHKAGHRVTLAVRDPGGRGVADLKTQGLSLVPMKGAAEADEVIVLAVPWDAVPGALKALGPLNGKILVDVNNPLTSSLELAVGHDDSAGETVARLAPGARVIKAFNTTGSANMTNSKYAGGKLMMPVAGDDAEAKQTVMALARDLGFEPVDVGPLAMSRHLEPLAMLWIKLALVQKLGMDFGFALLRR
jgi:predicted dinucleotide-binding enzyme